MAAVPVPARARGDTDLTAIVTRRARGEREESQKPPDDERAQRGASGRAVIPNDGAHGVRFAMPMLTTDMGARRVAQRPPLDHGAEAPRRGVREARRGALQRLEAMLVAAEENLRLDLARW
jgi:hypothetical protein